MPTIDLEVWNLEEGLAEVGKVQNLSRSFGYHVALGGGVLNNGNSTKDLDLYFLPLDNDTVKHDWLGLVVALRRIWGPSENIFEVAPGYSAFNSAYAQKLKFANAGKRIDVFIV